MSILWVDYRQGSKEFIAPLRKLGVDAKEAILDSADFAFEGNGPDGPVQIGVERKALSDLTTCLRDGRFAGMPTEDGKGGQLHRLLSAYDVVWLLVEGQWTEDAKGRLVTGRFKRALPGGFTADSLTKRLLSLEMTGPLHLKETRDDKHTAQWLASTFRWWTDKTWTQHATLNVTHTRHQSLTPLSRFREMVLPLPGVGLAGSKALELAFHGSMLSLLKAEEQVLAGIPVQTPAGPRKFGVRARELRAALNKLL